MKRLLLALLALTTPAFATLANPVVTITTAAITNTDGISTSFWAIPANYVFLKPTDVILAPDNVWNVIHSAATPNPVCYTTNGVDPTPITHGVCPAGTTTFTYGTSSPIHVDGLINLKFISTSSTDNSAVITTSFSIAPLGIYDGSTPYGFTPTVVMSGYFGGGSTALTYTTDGTDPTANSDCTATNGTSGANGTTITPTNGETIKVIGCYNGVTTSVTSGTYVIRSPINWYIRPGGGTRYDASTVPTGQCDGQADVDYPGSGVNQHCAFNDLRYMWDDDSGITHYPVGVWLLGGGETVIIRGCHALAGQANPVNPDCRIGWDNGGGNNSTNWWGYYNDLGSVGVYNPAMPPGISGQHTKILGQNYAACNVGNDPKSYAANLTQLFSGFGAAFTLNLDRAYYADVQCLELTEHNSTCIRNGDPVPTGQHHCSSSITADDAGQSGIQTTYNTSNVTLQDIYIHGQAASGLAGPIGGPITITRVFIGFNAFAGWNFDTGTDIPDAPGAQIIGSYVTMIGNGCYEQYPLSNTFPARACYDSVSNGFGDSWSGQDTFLDTFNCDHCQNTYNTKDGWIGPHVYTKHSTVTNSYWYGNMGTAVKVGQDLNADLLFQNDLVVGNCTRMTETPPGAAQNFAQSTGLSGSYLTNFCRAGGAEFATATNAGSYQHYYGNTILGAGPIVMQMDCGFNPGGMTTCGASSFVFKDNNFIGYTPPSAASPPALFYTLTTPLPQTSAYNNEYGLKAGTVDTCGVNNITCADPLMLSEPAQPWPGTETSMDVFNPFNSGNSFYPSASSPLILAGTTLSGLTTDYYATSRTSPPWLGAVNSLSGGTPTASAPMFSPSAPYSGGSTTLTMTTSSSGAIICYNTTGASITIGGGGTCPGGSTLYTSGIPVTVTSTFYAKAGGTGWLDSTLTTGTYTVTAPTVATPTGTPIGGTYPSAQTVTLTTSTGGASIIYTNDSTPPTVTALTCTITHGTLYTVPISVATTQTIKAIGCLSGYNASGVLTAGYIITPSATPTFAPPTGYSGPPTTVTLSTATTACVSSIVWNTTNAQTGGNLTGTSSTNPVSVAASETVYAQVQGCPSYLNSAIGSAAYVIGVPTGAQVTITGTATISGNVSIK